MFPRLAEHYRSVVEDLVMSLQALASSLTPDQLQACIDEVTRDSVKRRTPLVSAPAVGDRVTAV